MTPKTESFDTFVTTLIDSPIGTLTLVAAGDALVGVYFEGHRPAPRVDVTHRGSSAVLRQAARELAAYFADPRHRFAIALAPRGTELQCGIWRELNRIPLGRTQTYGGIASTLGRPGAARAVGSAVARNPLSIIVPCHRVIGASGALTGFAGGVERKSWLLAHEGVDACPRVAVVREGAKRTRRSGEADPALPVGRAGAPRSS